MGGASVPPSRRPSKIQHPKLSSETHTLRMDHRSVHRGWSGRRRRHLSAPCVGRAREISTRLLPSKANPSGSGAHGGATTPGRFFPPSWSSGGDLEPGRAGFPPKNGGVWSSSSWTGCKLAFLQWGSRNTISCGSLVLRRCLPCSQLPSPALRVPWIRTREAREVWRCNGEGVDPLLRNVEERRLSF